MTNDSTPAVPESERCAYCWFAFGIEVLRGISHECIAPEVAAPAASEAPADGPVARHYHALGREMAADDLEVSPALERFRKKAEAATAGNYCVSCGRSFGEPTITREQFARAVDAWRNSYGQKDKDATDDEIAYGLKHAFAAAGITVAE